MKQFLKFMFASAFGVILAGFFIMLFTGIILMGIVSSATEKEEVKVEENSILKIKFNQAIDDRGYESPFDELDMEEFGYESKMGLNDILESLEKASGDDRIKGIYMNLSSVPAGVAVIEEIRIGLEKFKESGKFIVVYAEYMSQGAYYLATVADEIYLNPEGSLIMNGLSAGIMYYKTALEKLGIEPQVVRHGKYKSAVEPFLQDEMSEANREQLSKFVNSVWSNFLTKISEAREVSVAELNLITDSLKLRIADDAVKYKLVDDLKYLDEIETRLKELTETEADKDLNFIKLSKYKDVPEETESEFKGQAKDKIAVIYAGGGIVDGKGDENSIGSHKYARLIEEAREDSSIKAIVLRVNSPGGSALASDVILREVILTKGVKPIVVSMGNYAASGGYYISCMADKIVADANTITGSIGVFGLFFSAEELMNEKLGLKVHTVNTNTHSDFGNVARKFSPTERMALTDMIEDVYTTFVNHVMKGRNMSYEEVDAIAQGRIWTGSDAKEIGLVDKIGGLNDAIAIAQEMAELEKYRLVEFPEIKDPFEQIILDLTGEGETKIIANKLGANYKYYRNFMELANMQGIQAKLPFSIEIE